MNIKNLFHRKRRVPVGSADRKPQPLRIEGIGPAPLTPEPDEAELAAQALLEMMASASDKSRNNDKAELRNNGKADSKAAIHDAAYYRQLAERIRQEYNAATYRTMRFLAFVEQELKKPHLPSYGPCSLTLLETELYKRMDIIERRGGDLKRRWQHCLAQVLVRQMKHTDDTTTDNTDSTD